MTAIPRLLLIDPDDRGQAERLERALDAEFARRGWANMDTADSDVVDAVQAALRVLAGEVRR